MKTIAIFNVKGGVGKTTTATTIAHLLATQHKKKVLLVDLDPQSNTSAHFRHEHIDILSVIQSAFLENDLSILNTYEKTVGDLLLKPELAIEAVITKTAYENLSLLPAFLDLAEIEEQIKADIRTPQQFRLKVHLDKVQDQYDYCILDLSPSINMININGLVCTDYVLTPLRCDEWGLAGYCVARNLIQTVAGYNRQLKLGGCFFIQWDGRNRVSKKIRELVQAVMGDQYIDIPIRKCIKVEEMTHMHQALVEYAPEATAAADYMELTEYIIQNF